ncbi:polysaccharide deacetylase family protein [Paucibacter sp. R3-3]|uniref:Polysaccharide deacetylase family protein n=1 Tax=Roseateles agri TaxID=3098619 RepID=A0ABU5DAJ0_9BURK|nr:polysaccharide deacetylase family protein [Paucibacter sp. R3-3]MDY0743297.1 polysaccharide deacetylase family protein [Paucibacter sp. R3-3]
MRCASAPVALLQFAAILGLAGCGSAPVPPVAPPTLPAPQAPIPARGGEVLGQSERFVIYQPGPGDTLRSVAERFLGDPALDWVIGDFNDITQLQPGQPLAVPLKPLNPTGVHAGGYQTVPILCYHRFGGAAGKMSVSPANFAAQLDWLARNDWHVIRLAQLQDYLAGRQSLPRRSVVITIDDGYESSYRHAFPLLRQHGFPATVFVYTDFIGSADALNWAQMQEMAESGLIDIQAHSKTHRNLIERAAQESEPQYRQQLEAEARLPRELLQRRLPVQVRHFAYPYGDANDAMLDVMERQQYALAVTVTPGGNGFFAPPLMLRRTMIFGDTDLDAFKAKLQISRGFSAP